MIKAEVRADSISRAGKRITTLEVTMPRFLLAQFNTHRMFSRNSASSRAIPTEKLIKYVKDRLYKPDRWGTAQRGMVAGEELPYSRRCDADGYWHDAMEACINAAESLALLGVAKEHVNRLLEPFMYTTVLVTATEWDNFFKLRLDHAAQPEMQEVAKAMNIAIRSSSPALVNPGHWHMPFSEHMPEGLSVKDMLAITTARCARLSYTTHDGEYSVEKDVQLHDNLLANGHMSPFEHCAMALHSPEGERFNLRGWASYRWFVENKVEVW